MPATPQNLRSGVSAAESARIFALAPQRMQQAATTLATSMSGGRTKEAIVSAIVVDFQMYIAYGLTSTAVTEGDIDVYVRTRTQELSGGPGTGESAFRLTHLQNGDTKTLLMSYFGVQPTGAPLAPDAQVPVTTALELFRDNLLEYKLTGNASYKNAAEGAKRWLDSYLASLNFAVTRTADSLTTEIASYSTASGDLSQTQADFQRVKTEGPALDDKYTTLKRQLGQQPVQDSGNLYVKGGIAIGLVLGAVALSFL